MPARSKRLPPGPELEIDLGVLHAENRREIDDGGIGRRDPRYLQEDRSDPFVHQNSAVLWIVANLTT